MKIWIAVKDDSISRLNTLQEILGDAYIISSDGSGKVKTEYLFKINGRYLCAIRRALPKWAKIQTDPKAKVN